MTEEFLAQMAEAERRRLYFQEQGRQLVKRHCGTVETERRYPTLKPLPAPWGRVWIPEQR